MKTILIAALLLLAYLPLQAQDYVDLFRLTSHNTTMGNEDNDYQTNIYNQQLQVYLPVRVSERFAIITGFTVENTILNLFEGADNGNLWMARLNLGVKVQYSDRWEGTYLVLPKIASDFREIGQRDWQIGGLGLWGYQLSETWKLKFGLYVSTENHGSTVTPLLGVWHRSKNGKFYINAVLPIRMDVNYALTNAFSVGAHVLTSIKSYNLLLDEAELHAKEESIRLGGYLSYGFMDNALILRARAGLDLTDYSLFGIEDKIGAQVLAWPVVEDRRSRLNPIFDSGFYFGGDLIYRFDLRKEKK